MNSSGMHKLWEERRQLKSRVIEWTRKGLILFSLIFSFTTILSSSLQLYNGQMTDTNYHILNRAAVVLIATVTIILFKTIKLWCSFMSG